jgi:polyphosphate glucokinase
MRDQMKVHETDADSVKLTSANKRNRTTSRPDQAALTSLAGDVAVGRSPAKQVLVIDVGGSSVKILATGQKEHRSFRSGPTLTPSRMVSEVKELVADWPYDLVSIGVPGPVLGGRPIGEPHNLGRGWVGFDFARAFGCPVKVVNDAAMQALGSYRGGKMLFLGLGTGLGTAMIVEGIVAPMEVGHLPYKKATYENYVGRAGLERHGKKKWRLHVADVVQHLIEALRPDDTVIGGGNVTKLKTLPRNCRAGENANAFRGGFELWAKDSLVPPELAHGGNRDRPEGMPQRATRSEISPRRTASGPGSRDHSRAAQKTFVGAATPGGLRTKRKQPSAGLWRAS